MKTPFLTCPWARGCWLLFAFAILPLSDAQCGPLGRALGAIRNRVDHVLHKVGIGKEREPVPSGAQQNERTTEAVDPRHPPPPMNDREALRQQSSTPAGSTVKPSEKSNAVATKPPTKSPSKPQAPAVSAVASASKSAKQTDDAKTPAIKPTGGSPSESRTAAVANPQSGKAQEAPPASPPAKILFAKPVPGKRGFVYAPGATEDMKNILDVRGFTPGQKMRDPRTGNTFLVP
jgi:hypothetical protein